MMTPHIRALAALLYNTILLSWWLEQVLIVCKNSCFCGVQRPLATLLLFLLLSWSASVQSPGHGAAVVVRRGNWRSDVWSEDSFTSSNSFHWSPPSHHTTSMSKLEQGWRWLGKKKVAAGPTRKNFRFSFPWFFLYGYVYVSLVRSVVCAFIFISSPPPPPLPPPPRLLPPPPPPVAHCYEEEKIIGMFDKLLLSNHVGVTYGELLGAAPRW